MQQAHTLSNIQQELLKVYSTNIPEAQLLEVRDLLGNYFAQKATDLLEEYFDAENISSQDVAEWANGHNRTENCSCP